jgi:hypothetical protein
VLQNIGNVVSPLSANAERLRTISFALSISQGCVTDKHEGIIGIWRNMLFHEKNLMARMT